MPSTIIKCGCGKAMVIFAPRRNGTATAFMAHVYKAGWTLRERDWFCSDDCLADAALDITPVDKLLTKCEEPSDA
jgi:hypothetical protein